MLNQSAFKNPEEALKQFKAYLINFQIEKGWARDLISLLENYADQTYSSVKSLFSSDQTETSDFWKNVSRGSIDIINAYTANDPGSLPSYNQFVAFLSSASGTSFAESQSSGVSGVANVVAEQMEDFAEEIKEATSTGKKILPFLVIGGTALFLLAKFR